MPLFKVFISHDQHDMKNVNRFSEILRWNDVEPLVAEPTPEPGLLVWKEKISRMIRDSDYFVVFLSQSSQNNPNVNQEIGAAGILGKRMFALLQKWLSERDLKGFLEGIEVVKDYETYYPCKSLNYLYQLLYQAHQGEFPTRFFGCHRNHGKVLIRLDEVSGKWYYYRMNSKTAEWEQAGEYPDRF